MFNIFRKRQPKPQHTQETIKSILETAIEQDINVSIVNPQNRRSVHVVSKQGQLWIDGVRVC